MEIFGVGPLELLLVLVLALVILGPEDMVGTSRRIGQWIYRTVRSPTWRAILSTTQDLRELPQKIVRDAGIEDAMNEVKGTINDAKSEISAATTEVNMEMQAATHELNSEMQVASQQVSQNMQLPGQDAIGAQYTPPDNSSNQIWPEQALATYEPPNFGVNAGVYAGRSPHVTYNVYSSSAPHNPAYAMQLEEFGRALATSPRSAADLEGIVRPPEPPPPPLAEPVLISSALSFVAFGAAPANLEVPFVFADPTDYPDPEPVPAAELPQAPVEALVEALVEVSSETPDSPPTADAPSVESGETLAAPVESGEAPRLPTEDEINAGLERAMQERMRKMEASLARLNAKAAQDASPAKDPPPPGGIEPASET